MAAALHAHSRRGSVGVHIGSGAGGALRISDHLPTMLIMLIMLIISWWCDHNHF